MSELVAWGIILQAREAGIIALAGEQHRQSGTRMYELPA